MTHTLILFLLAAISVQLFPGTNMIYILSQSLNRDKSIGFLAALGVSSGYIIHVLSSTIGLSSFIYHSSHAFTIIKIFGSGYLFYIGLTSIFKKQSALSTRMDLNKLNLNSRRKAFKEGFLTNILNPKVALFFMAFLPQFVDLSLSYSIEIQLFILGLIYICSGTMINMLMAALFSTIRQWLFNHPTILKSQEKITGMLLIGLALRLARS